VIVSCDRREHRVEARPSFSEAHAREMCSVPLAGRGAWFPVLRRARWQPPLPDPSRARRLSSPRPWWPRAVKVRPTPAFPRCLVSRDARRGVSGDRRVS